MIKYKRLYLQHLHGLKKKKKGEVSRPLGRKFTLSKKKRKRVDSGERDRFREEGPAHDILFNARA